MQSKKSEFMSSIRKQSIQRELTEKRQQSQSARISQSAQVLAMDTTPAQTGSPSREADTSIPRCSKLPNYAESCIQKKKETATDNFKREARNLITSLRLVKCDYAIAVKKAAGRKLHKMPTFAVDGVGVPILGIDTDKAFRVKQLFNDSYCIFLIIIFTI